MLTIDENGYYKYPNIRSTDFDLAKMQDVDIINFFEWYKINKETFYDGESTERIVGEWRRQTGNKV